MTKSLYCAPTKAGMIVLIPLLLLVAVAAASAAKADVPAPDAASFIQRAFDKSFADLDNVSLGASERRQRFHEAVLNLIDVRNTAYYTLGSFAAQTPAGDVDAFIRAYREYAATSYEDQFGSEVHPSLKVTGVRPAEAGDSLVTAMLARPDAGAMNIIFRVRNPSGEKPAVVDVQLGGIWMSTLKREEFTAFLHRNGGNVTKLTEALNKTAQDIRTKRQG